MDRQASISHSWESHGMLIVVIGRLSSFRKVSLPFWATELPCAGMPMTTVKRYYACFRLLVDHSTRRFQPGRSVLASGGLGVEHIINWAIPGRRPFKRRKAPFFAGIACLHSWHASPALWAGDQTAGARIITRRHPSTPRDNANR